MAELMQESFSLFNGYEDFVPCGICGGNHECAECGIIEIKTYVFDRVVPSHARLTVPACLSLEKMADETYSIIAKDFIECGARFGPLKADALMTLDPNIAFPLKLFMFKKTQLLEYYLNTNDESRCNWLMFIAPARTIEEQNLICFQENGKIVYVAIKDIEAGEHFKVWYAPYYALKMDRKLLKRPNIPDHPDNEKEKDVELVELDQLVKNQQKILARESWTCKFCGQVEQYAPQFAQHIRQHYRAKHYSNAHCDICNKSFDTLKLYRKHLKVMHEKVYHKRLRKKKLKPDDTELNNKDTLIGGPLLNNLVSDSMDNTSLLLSNVDLAVHSPALPNNLSNENILLDLSLNVENLLNDNVKELDQFNFEVNDSQEKYVCDICLNPFSELYRFSQHLNKHTGQFTCQNCLKVFSRKEYLNAHKCSIARFSCELCQKVFKLRKHLIRHVNSAHSKKFNCKNCNKYHYSQVELNQHNCSAIPDDCKPTFTCTICSKRFLTQKYLTKHLKTHNKSTLPKVQQQYICEICAETFMTRHGFNHHKKTHAERPFSCKVCSKRFHRNDVFKIHMAKHNGVQTVKRKQPQCTVCNKTFKTLHMLTTHQEKEHLIKPLHPPQLYECESCDKVFLHKHTLVKHNSKVHIKTCSYCKKNFETEDLLKMHMFEHTKNCYECPVCKTKIKHKSSFTRHLKLSHPVPSSTDMPGITISNQKVNGTVSPVNQWNVENNDEVGKLISFAQNQDNNEVSAEFENYSSCQSILDSFEDILNGCHSNDPINLLGNTSENLGKENNNDQNFGFDDFDLDIQSGISSGNVRDAPVCLSMPDLMESDHEVTLGEKAYMLEDGTIVEPSSNGEFVVYITKEK